MPRDLFGTLMKLFRGRDLKNFPGIRNNTVTAATRKLGQMPKEALQTVLRRQALVNNYRENAEGRKYWARVGNALYISAEK